MSQDTLPLFQVGQRVIYSRSGANIVGLVVRQIGQFVTINAGDTDSPDMMTFHAWELVGVRELNVSGDRTAFLVLPFALVVLLVLMYYLGR